MRVIAGLIVLLVAAGCVKIGPETVARDSFNYSNAINESLKQQVLLNIVRLRYVDNPLLMDVSQVVASYTLQGQVSLDSRVQFGSTDFVGLGAQGLFKETPTITYTPVAGKHMIERLLEPVPPSAVLFLIQSGWRADRIINQTVNVANGYRNSDRAQGLRYDGDEQFYRFGEILLELQRVGALGLRVSDPADGSQTSILALINPLDNPAIADMVAELQNLMNLNPGVDQYAITFGSVAPNDTTIALQTRSTLQIMLQMASDVDVPDEHLNRIVAGNPGGAASDGSGVTIHVSPGKPVGAFVAVPYRNYWYWIDDTDLATKGQFWVLMMLLTISEGDETAATPILTIPAN